IGKADFLSPQKLHWYCQMCQKQCTNGFKCHCMSESHQRQLLLASENPNQFMSYFSDDFLELLQRRFVTVYNEYISNREHVHMNSTQTLTDFTKRLGREGKHSIHFIHSKKLTQPLGQNNPIAGFVPILPKHPELSLLCVFQMEEQKKKSVRSDNWIQANIVVKVITKKLGEKYYKNKAVIREVQDKYTAVVKMIDSGDKLKLDQSHSSKRVLILNGQYKDTEAILEGTNSRPHSR
uniref:Kin17 DNA and RNA binding protein n=1 Tax=Sinocyclocheilus anshuiensis TaxID=1608454 RepID=A0A671LRG4_9TELE